MYMSKTNAIRILEAKKITFSFLEYEYDEDNLNAVEAARKIGAEVESVFKTLVTHGNKTGINVFCIPANFELDLKKAAKASGNKSLEMVKVKELFDLTGYIRGGCSPIGMKKDYPIYIDEIALLFPEIYVSAGMRGVQIKIAPQDLQKATGAMFVGIT
ncbi:MAG: Cys-tRNA(Pro) deacylase [Bacteroidota bacterium]|nr:Cys-tRNA(Pro) deacylase [Bacteroidota bacterium]